jgi:GxxExxY protein
MKINEITRQVIAAAIEVHKQLGAGMLESVYEECLCHELALRGLRFERQKAVPVSYKGVHLDVGFRIDLLVESCVVLEVKAVEKVHPIMKAKLRTYLRCLGVTVGLLINFHEELLTQGVSRVVNNFKEE